jgi:hypothetical protein
MKIFITATATIEFPKEKLPELIKSLKEEPVETIEGRTFINKTLQFLLNISVRPFATSLIPVLNRLINKAVEEEDCSCPVEGVYFSCKVTDIRGEVG